MFHARPVTQPLDLSQDDKIWRPLRLFNYYRIIIACIFIGLFLLGPAPSILGQHDALVYYVASLGYLLFGLSSAYLIHRQRSSIPLQAYAQVVVDIVVLTLLMHTSGGVPSGLGILLIITVAFSSLIVANNYALGFAALATLAILFQSVYVHLVDLYPKTTYTHAGLLGVAFFATALISIVLSKRLSESEARVVQREIDLANLEKLNEYIIQNLHSGIIVVDKSQRIRLMNESARYLLNNARTDTVSLLNRLSTELANQVRAWYQDNTFRPRAFKPTNDAAEVLPRFAPLSDKENLGTVIFLEDAADVSQHLQQMKLAALGRLTASIAHEIRNPLAAISHAAQLLGESAHLDPTDARLARIIHSHTQRMNTIIENVLQLSRRELSHPEQLQLLPWLTRFKLEFCGSAGISPERLGIEVFPEDTTVSMDPTQLQQILWNLCQNALQHGKTPENPEPRITLRGGHKQTARGPYLDVVDNGPGISVESAPQIFEPFFTTSPQGTGLGLFITRELCEANRSRLNYLGRNADGHGFRISFFDPERIKL